jgi:hypothetical protein
MFLATLAALLAAATARGASLPAKSLDECTGGFFAIHVKGWAYAPDVPSQSLTVHVYLYTDSGCTSQYGDTRILTANVARSDVNQAHGITGNLVPAEAAKRTYTVYGKADLADPGWTLLGTGLPWRVPANSGYHFFRVTVEMR